MNKKDKVAQVYFREWDSMAWNRGPYSFLTNISLQPGDLVACDTRYGVALAMVSKVLDTDKLYSNADILPLKRILTRVNLDEYYAEKKRQEEEERLKRERENRISTLEIAMDNIVRKQSKIVQYENIAQHSPELRTLLNEYKTLKGE